MINYKFEVNNFLILDFRDNDNSINDKIEIENPDNNEQKYCSFDLPNLT